MKYNGLILCKQSCRQIINFMPILGKKDDEIKQSCFKIISQDTADKLHLLVYRERYIKLIQRIGGVIVASIP